MTVAHKKHSPSSWQAQWARDIKRAALEREQLWRKQQQEEQLRAKSTVVDQVVAMVGPIPEELRAWMMDLHVQIDTEKLTGWYVDCDKSLTIDGLKGASFWDDNCESAGFFYNFGFDLGDLADAQRWKRVLEYISTNNTRRMFPDRPSDVEMQLCKLCQSPKRTEAEWEQLLKLTKDNNRALAILACYFAAVGRKHRDTVTAMDDAEDDDDGWY